MSGRGKSRGRGRGRGFTSANDEGFWGKPNSRPEVQLRQNDPGNSAKYAAGLEEERKVGERKFADACKEIQKNVEKYIATHQFDNVESDEEDDDDDLEEDGIIEKLYQGYSGERSSSRTDQFLKDACKTGAQVCLVCIDNIKHADSVWSCKECFCSFHMSCVQKWAKDSIYQLAEAHLESDPHFNKSTLKWCCPKCRNEYAQSDIPSRYYCYCGKEEDPKFDPWLVPHSCGETCRKLLKPECGHYCFLLCHPGPCPPCPSMVQSKCYCGSQPAQTRRCSAKAWSCGKPCGGLLRCGQHTCEEPCHADECKPCPRQSLQPCLCGSGKKKRFCADPTWQCDKVCGKAYSCGHHECKKVCHSGECGKCPSSGPRTCPCGKTSHILPCTEKIPSCGDTCGKQLACGIHYCADRCHKGSCAACLQFCVKKCRCGAREKEMACSKEFTCEIKCKNIKDCRRHNCNRKCCEGNCPPCEHLCGRTLSCRNHKCKSRCHPGPCYPCSLTHTISCSCKATTITVPCGREKNTPPPKCSKLCRKPPACHHPARAKHKCHSGECPQCRMMCSLKLNCGHICPALCHDAVPIKIVSHKKRAGPWEPVEGPRIEIQKKPCPPCQVPVPTTCFGNHETVNWPCCDIRPHSCGRKCGRLSACTNHTCARECHVVEGAVNDKEAGKNCAPCEELCSKPRPDGCSHTCGKPCHRGKCSFCKQLVKVKCHCGLNNLYIECHTLNSAATDEKEALCSCKNHCNKSISCSHRCMKECHSGPCSDPTSCRKRVTIRCPCRRIKKDAICHLVISGQVVVECDEVCLEKIKALEEEKRREEEELKRKELESLEKLNEGRKHKKKNRKHVEAEVAESQWTINKWMMLGFFILIFNVLIYTVYNFNQ